jgi:hypothetical protein
MLPENSTELRKVCALVPFTGTLRVEQGHADFVGDLVEFFVRDGFEGFAAALELLVDLHGFLLHRAMRLFAAANELEVFACGDAGMTVLGVEAETQEPGFLLRLWRFALLVHGVAT